MILKKKQNKARNICFFSFSPVSVRTQAFFCCLILDCWMIQTSADRSAFVLNKRPNDPKGDYVVKRKRKLLSIWKSWSSDSTIFRSHCSLLSSDVVCHHLLKALSGGICPFWGDDDVMSVWAEDCDGTRLLSVEQKSHLSEFHIVKGPFLSDPSNAWWEL